MKRGVWRHYSGIMLVVLTSLLCVQPVAFPQTVAPAGEVVVYSARIESLIKPMFDAFTVTTGIPVKYFTAGEKELFERLQSEGVNTPADVFMTVDVGNLWITEHAGLLQVRAPQDHEHGLVFHRDADSVVLAGGREFHVVEAVLFDECIDRHGRGFRAGVGLGLHMAAKRHGEAAGYGRTETNGFHQMAPLA